MMVVVQVVVVGQCDGVGDDAGAGVCDDVCDCMCCGEGSGKMKDRHCTMVDLDLRASPYVCEMVPAHFK